MIRRRRAADIEVTEPEPAAIKDPEPALTPEIEEQPNKIITIDNADAVVPEFISSEEAIERFSELSDQIKENMDVGAWNDRALEVLSYAEKGQTWALKELAHNLANGVSGAAENDVLAVAVAQISADMGHEESQEFVRYMIAHNDFDGVTAVDENTNVHACQIAEEVVNNGEPETRIECFEVEGNR